MRALIDAIQAVFSCPGVLIAGFSLPPERRASQEPDAPPDTYGDKRTKPASHGLDTEAISSVFEAILLVLDSDVVLALRKTLTDLLHSIEAREAAAEQHDTRSALAQAQWLKLFVILLMNPINSDANTGAYQLPAALAHVAFLLKPKARDLLTTWLAALPPDVLGGRCLRPLQRHLTTYVKVLRPCLAQAKWTANRVCTLNVVTCCYTSELLTTLLVQTPSRLQLCRGAGARLEQEPPARAAHRLPRAPAARRQRALARPRPLHAVPQRRGVRRGDAEPAGRVDGVAEGEAGPGALWCCRPAAAVAVPAAVPHDAGVQEGHHAGAAPELKLLCVLCMA
jgi:hypothetical protein